MKSQLFKDWAMSWLQYQKQFIKESTYGTYSNIIINRLIPAFGRMPLDDIDEDCIQNYVLLLLRQGRLDGKGGLSDKTVHDILMVLKKCLKRAKREKLLKNAEFEIVFPTVCRGKQRQIFDLTEQAAIAHAVRVKPNGRNLGILLCLRTGLRIGELCALTWENIDLKNCIIEVKKTLQRVYVKEADGTSKSYILVDTPKSSSSIRSIPMAKTLSEIMEEYNIKNHPGQKDFLLSGNVHYVEPRNLMFYYKQFLKNADIRYRNFHCLRHTFATKLVELGADCKTVSALLGHASVSTTMNLYVHPQMDIKRKCVELLDIG